MFTKTIKKLVFVFFITIFTSNSSIFAMQKQPSFWEKFFKKITSLFSSSSNSMQPSQNTLKSLQQEDFWRCGYFASFNAYILYKTINGKAEEELPEILTKINLQDRQEQFEVFFSNLNNSEFKNLIQNKAWLSANQIEILLDILSEKPIYTQLINISIIDDSTWKFDSRPSENYILQNITNLREKNIPQVIICVLHGHWTTHVFTKNKIWTTNSISNYEQKETTNFLRHLHYYFTTKKFDSSYKSNSFSSSSSTQIIDLTKEDQTQGHEIIDLTKEPKIIDLTNQPEIIDLT